MKVDNKQLTNWILKKIMEEQQKENFDSIYYQEDHSALDEILGSTPNWLLRSGIGVVCVLLVILLIGSMYFHYPDVIQAGVVVVSDNPPVNLHAASGGKIEQILKQERDVIDKGEIVAYVESPLDFEHVQWLKQLLETFELSPHPDNLKTDVINEFPKNLSLGQLQNPYNEFVKAYHDLHQFKELSYHPQRLEHLSRQLEEQVLLKKQVQGQLLNYEEIYELAAQNYRRDSILFVQDVISPLEYEKAKSEYISRRISLEEYQGRLINIQIQKNELRSNILDTRLDYSQRLSEHQLRLQTAIENLKSQLLTWEKTYAFVAPLQGELIYAGVWKENQFVNVGDLVFSIIPEGSGGFIARGGIPLHGSGKVEVGDRVNIRLNNYPYQEYGVLQGHVAHISPTPAGEYFPVQITLENRLVTSYNYDLGHHVFLDGVAEIITDDVSLFNRMINPLRSLIKNR